jgi:hypothetical protein
LFKPALAAFAAAVILAAMPPAGAQQAVQAQLDVPFELQWQQEAAIEPEDIIIRFISFIEDSRCPSDVVCIQAGTATIRLSIEVDGQDAGQPTLVLGEGEDKASATFGQYVVRFVGLEPYPVSTVETGREDYVAGLVVSKLPANSAGVFLRAAGAEDGKNIAVISGWNLERSKGTLVMLVRDESGTRMSIARFSPSVTECIALTARECIHGQVVEAAGSDFRMGEVFDIEVSARSLFLSKSDIEYTLDLKNIKTRQNGPTVELGEGDHDGPLLVQEIGDDYVSGLNFPEYPVAVSEGLPVTLHVGESASNGCTITLTLLEIKQDTAVFSRTVDYNRPCPICFHST